MARAHDFAGLLAEISKNPDLAEAELVPGHGTRLIHLVASIVPTEDEDISYHQLLRTLVGGPKVDN